LKNIVLAVCCSVTLLGCGSTGKTVNEKATMNNTLANTPLTHLQNLDLYLNTRAFTYQDILLLENGFGDIRFSNKPVNGWLDVIRPDLNATKLTAGCRQPTKIDGTEEASNCSRVVSAQNQNSWGGVFSAYENFEDEFEDLYKSLSKLDELVATKSHQERKYMANYLIRNFASGRSLEQMSRAISAFNDTFRQNADEIIAKEHQREEKRKAREKEREKIELARAQKEQEREAERRKREQMLAEVRERERLKQQKEREAFEKEQRAKQKSINEIAQIWWDSRTASYENREVGDRICSFKGNKMGFVEQVAGEKIKVFWKGYVVEDDGYFFGNMPFHVFSKSELGVTNYTYTKISDTTWVNVSDVGRCVHEL
tara:strand:+ start:816 stop:1925 length:1110 start_codon:yes stop_codon:yes gene_type:complete